MYISSFTSFMRGLPYFAKLIVGHYVWSLTWRTLEECKTFSLWRLKGVKGYDGGIGSSATLNQSTPVSWCRALMTRRKLFAMAIASQIAEMAFSSVLGFVHACVSPATTSILYFFLDHR